MCVFELLENDLIEINENDKFIDTIRTCTFKIEEKEFLKLLAKQKLFEELKIE